MNRPMHESGVDWIGLMPVDWQLTRLKYLCEITTGDSDTQDANPDGEFPFYVRSPIVERSSRYTFDGDGVLMAGDGAGAGRIFHMATGKYAVHQRVYRMYKFRDVSMRFFWYYVSSSFPHVMDGGSAQSTVPSVRLPMLQNLPFALPPADEQRRIVSFLDRECEKIDALKAKIETQIAKLEELRKSMITRAVTTGLREGVELVYSGDEWYGDIPKGWSLSRIKYIASLVTDGSHVSPDVNKGEYNFVSVVDVCNGRIDFEHCVKTSKANYDYCVATRCKPMAGDVLIGKDGSVGRTVVVPAECDFVVASSLVIIRPLPSEMDPRFLDYALRSSVVQDRLQMLMHGAGLKRVSVSKNANLVVAQPSLAEQCEIADYLDVKTRLIDTSLSNCRAQLDKLSEYRKSLIYEYVTGKKEVA